MQLVIRRGRVIDPFQGVDAIRDILVENERIQAIETLLPDLPGATNIDASGLLVTPGFIDMHVHLREPGFEAKETIASGTRAAAMGGFTTVACMPNTNPVADNQSVITYIKERARQTGLVNVLPIGAITKGSKGEELAEIGDLVDAGAVALSDDGQPVMHAGLMRRALEYAGSFGIPVISHCEDTHLVAGGVVHEGYAATVAGLKGIPAAAEEVMVAREIILAELTGTPVHLAHLSTLGSIRLLKEAQGRGVRITGEVTPHHFTLTEAAVSHYDTNTKVNPPLRPEEDVAALHQALAEGTIEVIATDHAPHAFEDKDIEFERAAFGISGLETALPLVITQLVMTKILSWTQAITLLTVNPARILGIDRGTLAKGAIADITIIDPELELTINTQKFVSLGQNSPFHGWKLKGWPVTTIVAGKTVMHQRRLQG
jgi:dihydroorotase